MCDRPNGEPTREAAMTVIAHDGNGRAKIWCDPCIAPLVAALNTNGLSTVASCCGHHRRNGSICLADGRILAIWPTLDAWRNQEHPT